MMKRTSAFASSTPPSRFCTPPSRFCTPASRSCTPPSWFCTPASSPGSRSLARKSASSRKTASSRKAAFTLPELLTVIAIIGLLMTASFGAMTRARVMAKRAKAETQLRQLVSAWEQYFTTYGSWPDGFNGPMDTSVSNLKPLCGENDYGIVFLNFTVTDGMKALTDPWGTPYELTFGSSGSSSTQNRNKTAFETTVALPRRVTLLP